MLVGSGHIRHVGPVCTSPLSSFELSRVGLAGYPRPPAHPLGKACEVASGSHPEMSHPLSMLVARPLTPTLRLYPSSPFIFAFRIRSQGFTSSSKPFVAGSTQLHLSLLESLPLDSHWSAALKRMRGDHHKAA